jgi:hypothetical protein
MKFKTGIVSGLIFLGSIFSGNAQAALCNIGDKASVEWKGSWYPAKVLQGGETQCFIHYTGYDSSWDEWVGPSRIRITSSSGKSAAPAATDRSWKNGDSVQVLWNGSWYPAHVIGIKGNSLKIRYDGYSSNWDEWVGPDRYK